MTNLITPPLELLRDLRSQFHNGETLEATWAIAFRAGADQELEACTKWIEDCGYHPSVPEDLFAARRPKPPSLKEQALESLHHLEAGCEPNIGLLRRALEALPE